jgi:hypothetical protein
MAQNIDFQKQAKDISDAINGASSALESATDESQRKEFLDDLVMLNQAKTTLEKAYLDSNLNEQNQLKLSKEESAKQLSEGSYVSKTELRPTPVNPTSFADFAQTPRINREQTRSNLIENASKVFGVDPQNIDVDSGLSGKERFALSALPTDQDRITFLASKYPDIQPVVIDGKNELFVKKGEKLVKVDEFGNSLADAASLISTAAKEVLPTVAAIGGAIAGAPSILGAAALSTGGYAATSGLQDMAIRKAMGIDAQPLEVLGRQGLTAAISFPIDIATAGTAKFLSRRMGRPITNELNRTLLSAEQEFAKSGYDIKVPVGAKFGESALEAQRTLAQMYPNSKNAARLNKNMEQLAFMTQAWKEAGNPEQVSQIGIARLRQQQSSLIDEIAGKDERAKRILTEHFDRRLQQMQVPAFEKEPVGNTLSQFLKEAEQTEIKINEKNYRGFYDEMDKKGVSVSFDEAKRKISSLLYAAKEQGFKTVDDKGIYSLIGRIDTQKQNSALAKELKNKLQSGEIKLTPEIQDQLDRFSTAGDAFTFEDISSLRQQLAEAVPEGGAAGKGDPAKNLASKISRDFGEYVDQLAEKNGMTDEWSRVNASHVQDRLLYERSSPGAILKQSLGDARFTPSQIVDNAISDPRNARDVLRAVSLKVDANGNSAEPAIRDQLQQAYFSQIGLTSKAGISPTSINYNPEMVTALWGDVKGAGMVKKLDELNKTFQVQKLNLDNLTKEDVSMLSSALGDTETRKVISTIAQKKALEKQSAKLADDKIIGLALENKWDKLVNGELASSAISSGVSSGSVSKVWYSMPIEERKAFSKDFMYELLGSYSATGKPLAKAPYITMPDADRFLKDVGQVAGQASTQEGRELLKKMKLVLGENTTNKFISAQKMIQASQVSGQRMGKDEVRAVVGAGGVSAYVAQGLGSFVNNRLMSAAYGIGALEPFLDILARDVGSAATEKAYSSMISKMLTTKAGVSAITDGMGNDPAFAGAMTKMISEIKQSESNAQNEIDKKPVKKP